VTEIRNEKKCEIKRKLEREGRFFSKRYRLLDSDDETLAVENKFDQWNKSRKEFGALM
jgi:hypothetical protein